MVGIGAVIVVGIGAREGAVVAVGIAVDVGTEVTGITPDMGSDRRGVPVEAIGTVPIIGTSGCEM